MKDLTKYIQGIPPRHWIMKAGAEAYEYYTSLSSSLPDNSLIADLGTYQGLSALALSYNEKVKVKSYDVTLENNLVSKGNIEFIEADIFERIDEIIKADLILVDLDPHDGIQEQRLLEILQEKLYTGITVWDDINKNLGMQNFWDKVELEKEDCTDIGHYTGTGVIYL